MEEEITYGSTPQLLSMADKYAIAGKMAASYHKRFLNKEGDFERQKRMRDKWIAEARRMRRIMGIARYIHSLPI